MKSVVTLAFLATLASAKTDYDGCTSFTSTVTVRPEPGYGNTYETVIWYVSDTLEICRGVDCGGGRAPPRVVPGCPLYSGTETVTASFLKVDPAAPTAEPVTTGSAPAETSTSEPPLDPIGSTSLGGGDDKETSTKALATTAITLDTITGLPTITRAPSPGNATTSGSSSDNKSTTVSSTEAPGAAAHPSAAALAINLIAGVAAVMAML